MRRANCSRGTARKKAAEGGCVWGGLGGPTYERRMNQQPPSFTHQLSVEGSNGDEPAPDAPELALESEE